MYTGYVVMQSVSLFFYIYFRNSFNNDNAINLVVRLLGVVWIWNIRKKSNCEISQVRNHVTSNSRSPQ